LFLSYTAGVIVVSLAIYGFWQIIKDIWSFINNFNNSVLPPSSLVVILKDMENDIEYLIRFLSFEMAFINLKTGEDPIDIVIVDAGSTDLTLSILKKMAEEDDFFTLVTLPCAKKNTKEILPFCRGALIHIFDLTGRMKKEEFKTAARFLLQSKN